MTKRILAALLAIALLVTVWPPACLAQEGEEPAVEGQQVPVEAPAETEAPVEPEPHAETEAPAETDAPVETEAPIETEAPVETVAPAETEAPVETEAPIETEAPAETEAPVETDAPVETEAPAESEAPIETEAPAETEAPVETEAPTETEAPMELSVSLSTSVYFAVANTEEDIPLSISAAGGEEPLQLILRVEREGALLQEEPVSSGALTYQPTDFGRHTFTLTATDAAGRTASESLTVPVAVREYETRAQWEASMAGMELTGEWHEDLLTVARTQLGYKENHRNFVIDATGERENYTRYGAWYGAPHSAWCVMFVSFCLHYARVPEEFFPKEANCVRWKKLLEPLGIWEEDQRAYEPQPGDLVFINPRRDGDDHPIHVAIVEKVEGDILRVIEGNVTDEVTRGTYKRTDYELVVAYANMQRAIDRATWLRKPEDRKRADSIRDVEGIPARVVADWVTLREQPDLESTILDIFGAAGKAVTLVQAERAGEDIWYLVQYRDKLGYVRSDLVLPESEADWPEPSPQEEPAQEADDPEEPVPAETEAPAGTQEPAAAPPETPAPTPMPEPPEEGEVTRIALTAGECVRLRVGPSTESAALFMIAEKGSCVTVLEERDGWYRVRFGERIGYIREDLLTFDW